jgi:hypothetical protein
MQRACLINLLNAGTNIRKQKQHAHGLDSALPQKTGGTQAEQSRYHGDQKE